MAKAIDSLNCEKKTSECAVEEEMPSGRERKRVFIYYQGTQ